MQAKNILVSIGITLAFASLVLLFFYRSGSPLGDLFSLFFFLIIMHYVALIYGILVFSLRLFKLLKNNRLLIYLLAGTANVFLFIIGITLYNFDQADKEWVNKCIVNLIVGLLILADGFIFKSDIKR